LSPTEAAAEDDLLADKIGFTLFLEGRRDDAGAATVDSRPVRERKVLGLACRLISGASRLDFKTLLH
jgi:hypothetical protein